MTDTEILRAFPLGHKQGLTASLLAMNIRISWADANDAIQRLASSGLIRFTGMARDGNGDSEDCYQITDKGRDSLTRGGERARENGATKMKIIKGKQKHAVRAVLYGVEGIGKTTLASQFPTPLFIDTEEGTSQLDVDRVSANNWQTLDGALIDLAGDPQGYGTVVIDTADWAERILIEHMLKTHPKKPRSIEDIGFGKGYTMAAERFAEFLAKCDMIIARGVNVLLLAHATVKRVAPPDMDDGYDRYELKLTKQSGPVMKEWADVVLFANYQTKIVEGDDGRKRGRGGSQRKLFTQRCAAWDAKNRYGLPSSIDMTIEALAPIFGQPGPEVPEISLEEAKATVQAMHFEETLAEKIRQTIDKTTDPSLLVRMKAKVEARGEEGELTADEVTEFLELIDSKLPVGAGSTEE